MLDHLLPFLVIVFYYYLKKFKKGTVFTPFEIILWSGMAGILIFSILAGKHLEGGAKSKVDP